MTTREDTLDLGHRYFVFSVFAALTIGSLLTVVLVGLAFSWLGAIVGVAVNVALVAIAAQLYSRGVVGLARIGLFAVAILCLLFLGLALTLRHPLGYWLLVGVTGAHAACYAIVLLSSNVTVFLADKRGERLELDRTGEVAAPTDAFVSTDSKVVLRDDLKAGYKFLSMAAFLAGNLLLLISLAAIVGGIVGLFVMDLGDWFGLLLIGVLTHVVGMVLITTSNDTNFLATTQGYEANHLTNTLTSLKMFFNLQLGLTGLMVVVLLIRWMATA
jgi:hypothetical protein